MGPTHVQSGSVPLCTCLLTCDPLPAALCFAVTRSLLLTCLVPVGLLALRYYYSRKVILAYLECALHTDMADIEQYYMKPPGEFWSSSSAHPLPLLLQVQVGLGWRILMSEPSE